MRFSLSNSASSVASKFGTPFLVAAVNKPGAFKKEIFDRTVQSDNELSS